jgi:hypothetical protein
MAGIDHDPLSDIQNIRGLLKDYAPCFAFLKELLQNADDGKASTLRLAWHPGIQQASHPLLKAPALIALNNGEFTKSDPGSTYAGNKYRVLQTKLGMLSSMSAKGNCYDNAAMESFY